MESDPESLFYLRELVTYMYTGNQEIQLVTQVQECVLTTLKKKERADSCCCTLVFFVVFLFCLMLGFLIKYCFPVIFSAIRCITVSMYFLTKNIIH